MSNVTQSFERSLSFFNFNENQVITGNNNNIETNTSKHRLFPDIDISKVTLKDLNQYMSNQTVSNQEDGHLGVFNGQKEGRHQDLSEFEAREQVLEAKVWAEEMTLDHLKWYLSEFPNNSYEDWIAAFAPENAKDYLK